MKILLDTCIWSGAKQALIDAGHEVQWVGDWKEDPGDEQILERAAQEKEVVVTLDKDFGELATIRRQKHAGIVRFVNISATEQGPICVSALQRYGTELQTGAIVTVERTRVQIRNTDQED